MPVTALDQHRRRAKLQQQLRLPRHLPFGFRYGCAGQQCGFRQVGREHKCQRQELHAQRLHRLRLQKPIARCCYHHRVDDRLALPAVQGFRDGVNGFDRGNHADLDRPDRDIRENGIDLGADDGRAQVLDGGDPAGVLCGDRGQHARAIDTERRERLDVGLDTGAAAAVGTGNGQGDGGHAVALNASSTASRSTCAAARGSA